MSTLRIEAEGPVSIITIDRPQARNSVDAATARLLADAFRRFDADPDLSVAVLTGADGCFCAGADLKQRATGRDKLVREEGDGPMGPTRMQLSKPVIAAVEGFAVAGGWSSRSGATCASRRATRSSACTAGAGACR